MKKQKPGRPISSLHSAVSGIIVCPMMPGKNPQSHVIPKTGNNTGVATGNKDAGSETGREEFDKRNRLQSKTDVSIGKIRKVLKVISFARSYHWIFGKIKIRCQSSESRGLSINGK